MIGIAVFVGALGMILLTASVTHSATVGACTFYAIIGFVVWLELRPPKQP